MRDAVVNGQAQGSGDTSTAPKIPVCVPVNQSPLTLYAAKNFRDPQAHFLILSRDFTLETLHPNPKADFTRCPRIENLQFVFGSRRKHLCILVISLRHRRASADDPAAGRTSLLASYTLLLEAARRPALQALTRRWTEAYLTTISETDSINLNANIRKAGS